MTLTHIYAVAPITVVIGVLVLGLLIGSFLNVVIYRLPKMMQRDWRRENEEYNRARQEAIDAGEAVDNTPDDFNLARPNSTCPHCKSPIKPWHNIPVVSFLWLKGACAKCGARISKRYPIIEAATGLLSVLIVWQFGATPQAWFGLLFLWSLACLTMIDIDHYLLPDSITLPLLWLGLLVNLFGVYTSLADAVIGAMAGYMSLWTVYWGFRLLTGKEGMGFGDFKLLAALGAWMGWQMLPLVIILSSFVGAVLGIAGIVLLGREKTRPLPFGPYLAIAGLVAFLWGDVILTQYLQFMDLTPR